MNQNQCVPSWELDDVSPIPQPPPPPPPRAVTSRSHSTSLSAGPEVSMLDYEVAELTWENGQLTMHGLGLPRVPSKSNLASAWADKTPPRTSGTLESIVNQATKIPQPSLLHGGACDEDNDMVPWLDSNVGPATSVSMTMDALVPTANPSGAHNGNTGVGVGCSTRVGSCSAAARVPVGSEWSVSMSASTMRDGMNQPAGDTCEQFGGPEGMKTNGLTSTSFATSAENPNKTLTVEDHDSVCHSRPEQKETSDEEERQRKGTTTKSSASTKRSRAAAIHNQSERKRRDKINQRMKTLQKLVPNSNKTDKASMLDEVIDYLKQLQAQVQVMNRMSLPSMIMPMTIQQQLQLSMMSQMNMGMGMGMGMDHMNMSINSMARPGISPVLNPSAFMPLATNWDGASSAGVDRLASQQALVPLDPLSTYLACQSQPTTAMEAYSRMAAMYQQLQQQQHQYQHQQPQGPSSNT